MLIWTSQQFGPKSSHYKPSLIIILPLPPSRPSVYLGEGQPTKIVQTGRGNLPPQQEDFELYLFATKYFDRQTEDLHHSDNNSYVHWRKICETGRPAFLAWKIKACFCQWHWRHFSVITHPHEEMATVMLAGSGRPKIICRFPGSQESERNVVCIVFLWKFPLWSNLFESHATTHFFLLLPASCISKSAFLKISKRSWPLRSIYRESSKRAVEPWTPKPQGLILLRAELMHFKKSPSP